MNAVVPSEVMVDGLWPLLLATLTAVAYAGKSLFDWLKKRSARAEPAPVEKMPNGYNATLQNLGVKSDELDRHVKRLGGETLQAIERGEAKTEAAHSSMAEIQVKISATMGHASEAYREGVRAIAASAEASAQARAMQHAETVRLLGDIRVEVAKAVGSRG